ncbi:hypothetical protein [Kurthia sibirica]|uniref:Uncharacterized protein n=1 Tax=Kurthia sibirica TaxID=202750 RepID=A0A2U3AP67_9BACL|nr:hypothetical protein [Kurthia sibirica]PWI26343.1 hypothetical protein DEX24_03125 [Kurthia sibirica]GEK34843.1 hypothetical protein KSI01_23760 [Kurthia sibirica]
MRNQLHDEQVCPYCEYVVEQHEANYDQDEEEITCINCDKVYVSKPQWKLEGWIIEKQCETCGKWTDEGYTPCECDE